MEREDCKREECDDAGDHGESITSRSIRGEDTADDNLDEATEPERFLRVR